jgi:very-short-patch-repair endonuclease
MKHRRRKAKRVNVYEFANQLRRNMTLAEKLLWIELQQYSTKWKLKFQTQIVVGGRFIADFVCFSKRLIVEVDGSIHRLTSVRRKDKYRTKVLNKLGYRIIRFTNIQVIHSITKVIRTIEEELLR